MKKITMGGGFLICFFVFLASATNIYADIQLGFSNITNNNAGDAAIGEAQLFVNVKDVGSNTNKISFLFSNIGPEASSITDIYFDDNIPLMTFDSFNSAVGVLFTVGADPGNLPGGNTISFISDYDYDSDNPAQPNGVNPGEYLEIYFNYGGGFDYDDIFAALSDGSMRIGIHVQGFESGGSEGFINTPPTPNAAVPEPATLLLMGMGLMGIGFGMRKKLK